MARLIVVVLGSAAGGGFPQWNCRCNACRLAWRNDPTVKWRTQASIAISADARRWIIVNASPDVRAQIGMTRALHPSDGVRSTPIEAIILTGAEIDQTAGLLSLRERQPFTLYGTAATLGYVAENPMFDALASATVPRRPVALDEPFELAGGIQAQLFAVAGKAPLYAEGDAPEIGGETAANVGVEFTREGARFAFVPGCALIGPALKSRLAGADAFMFDGTLFSDDELISSGTGDKTGLRMGHVSIDGPDGSLARLAGMDNRRIYIHINNTNPILIDGSPERRQVLQAGWEIAEDGMEIAV